MRNKTLHGDCLELMVDIPDGSIDMILCDLPYGITACKWDSVIPLEPLWEHYKRIIKKNGAIVLTASQPFTSRLVMSNPKMFKYCWVWEKSVMSGFHHAKNSPLRKHEDVAVFSEGAVGHSSQTKRRMPYNPQGVFSKKTSHGPAVRLVDEHKFSRKSEREGYEQTQSGYPSTILKINSDGKHSHPTQKPVALFEYLIKTYTQPGELVLDNCAGSGTTGVACQNLGRGFILMEQEEKYVEIIRERLK